MSDLKNKLLFRLFFFFQKFLIRIYSSRTTNVHRKSPSSSKYFRFKCNFYKCHINLIKCLGVVENFVRNIYASNISRPRAVQFFLPKSSFESVTIFFFQKNIFERSHPLCKIENVLLCCSVNSFNRFSSRNATKIYECVLSININASKLLTGSLYFNTQYYKQVNLNLSHYISIYSIYYYSLL